MFYSQQIPWYTAFCCNHIIIDKSVIHITLLYYSACSKVIFCVNVEYIENIVNFEECSMNLHFFKVFDISTPIQNRYAYHFLLIISSFHFDIYLVLSRKDSPLQFSTKFLAIAIFSVAKNDGFIFDKR